jgi:hypothetical protein
MALTRSAVPRPHLFIVRARIQKLVENFPDLAGLVEPLLIVRRALREQIVILHPRCWPSCETMRCAGA